jgi:hypothetical protein
VQIKFHGKAFCTELSMDRKTELSNQLEAAAIATVARLEREAKHNAELAGGQHAEMQRGLGGGLDEAGSGDLFTPEQELKHRLNPIAPMPGLPGDAARLQQNRIAGPGDIACRETTKHLLREGIPGGPGTALPAHHGSSGHY